MGKHVDRLAEAEGIHSLRYFDSMLGRTSADFWVFKEHTCILSFLISI